MVRSVYIILSFLFLKIINKCFVSKLIVFTFELVYIFTELLIFLNLYFLLLKNMSWKCTLYFSIFCYQVSILKYRMWIISPSGHKKTDREPESAAVLTANVQWRIISSVENWYGFCIVIGCLLWPCLWLADEGMHPTAEGAAEQPGGWTAQRSQVLSNSPSPYDLAALTLDSNWPELPLLLFFFLPHFVLLLTTAGTQPSTWMTRPRPNTSGTYCSQINGPRIIKLLMHLQFWAAFYWSWCFSVSLLLSLSLFTTALILFFFFFFTVLNKVLDF